MNIWKPIAIIAIVLFIGETMFFYYAIKAGNEEIIKENKCIINICEQIDYEGYIYEDGLCQCYKNGEVIKEEYIT